MVKGFPNYLRNPSSISMWAGAVNLDYEPLTAEEVAIFDRDLQRLAGYFASTRDLERVILEDRDIYIYAASLAKAQINVSGFGGLTPGSGQLGMQLIRSKTILGAANWLQTFAAAGWNNLFGTSAVPIDLSSTSTTYGNPQNRVAICIPKLFDITLPKFQEAWFHVGTTDYPIHSLSFMQLADLYVARLPAAVFVGRNGRFYARGNVIGNGVVSGLAPLGLTFALAEYMVSSTQE